MSTDPQAGPAPGEIHDPWRDSLRRSHDRRERAFRSRRRRLRTRGVLAVALLSLTSLAGGALAAPAGTPTTRTAALQVGSAGDSVAALQQKLGIPADGMYGPQTRAAVKRFQRANGLAVDGVAGPATLQALGLPARATTAAKRTTRRSATTRSSGSSASGLLQRIAQCESGGDPSAVSPDGRYRGKYQFSRETWRAVGGKGDPAAASEAEQDRRAAILMEVQGPSAWPSCSR